MLYIYALLCEAASGLTVTFIGRTNGRTYPPLALLNYTVSSIYRYYIYCCFVLVTCFCQIQHLIWNHWSKYNNFYTCWVTRRLTWTSYWTLEVSLPHGDSLFLEGSNCYPGHRHRALVAVVGQSVQPSSGQNATFTYSYSWYLKNSGQITQK